MRKSFFLLSTLILLKATGSYGQVSKEEAQWKCAFANDCTTQKKKALPNTGIYLIRLPKQATTNFFVHPFVSVKRQLDDTFYIVKATAAWVQQNQQALAYVAPANNNWKLSPPLLADPLINSSRQKTIVNITVADTGLFISYIQQFGAGIKVEKLFPEIKTFRIECSYAIVTRLLDDENVLYIQHGDRKAKVETPVADFNNVVNHINLVHAEYPAITGEGLNVSVKEEKFDSTDIDITGRTTSTSTSSNTISQHASTMATIIAGAGNSFYTGKGGAPAAQLSSADFRVLMPDNTAYSQYNISVQNHSYGVAIENFYGSDALAYDASIIARPSLVQVFSSGNSGNEASTDGTYKDITGFANLTGSFKMAKNILTVGAVDETGIVAPLSSKGPAYDGRVKPELVAYGQNGSSEAAAMVSGIVLLLQDAYAQQHQGTLPDNALLKAILINSAGDIGNKGIDFSSGYGNANAYRSVQNIQEGNFLSGSINSNEEKLFALSLPANAINAKFTLVWNDPPAAPNAFKSLVNDLDIQVTQAAHQWLPWVLNSFPHPDSLVLLPVRKKDSLNVVEQVTIDNPAAGSYTIHVNAGNITGTQNFYIAYQWDTLQHFKWTYPARTDNLTSAAVNTLRWSSQYPGKKGRLEYSITNGVDWRYIDSVDLDNQQYNFVAPDTFATALARISIDNTIYTSDTFTISSPLPVQVGFNCDDSVSLYWNKTDGVTNYMVYTMGSKYLEPARTVADTFVIFQKTAGSSPYYTIAPVLSAIKQGIKSETINTNFQGVECYTRNFLADLQLNNTVALTLNLSSSFNVKQIHFEKQQPGNWVLIQSLPVDTDNNYTATDNSLSSGINYYRAKIELTNGVFIYTDAVAVYYLANNNFIVFPNPVNRNQPLYILSKDGAGYTAILYDVTGRKVMQQQITDLLQPVSLRRLNRGLYILAIHDESKRVFIQKVVVL